MDSQTVSYLPMILFLIVFFFFFQVLHFRLWFIFWVNLCIWCKVWSVVVAVLFTQRYSRFLGFPGDSSGKEASCRCRRCGFDPWVRNIRWRRTWQHTPVFLLGKFHAQRSLAVHGVAKSQTQLSMCVCLCTHIHARAWAHTHTHSSLPASFVVPHRMWDPSSLTRAQICVSCIGRQSLNHSTTREVHDPWMYLANCTNLLTFLTTCEILSFQNKILNEICLISNWLWYFPEGLWKITKSLFLHLVNEMLQ